MKFPTAPPPLPVPHPMEGKENLKGEAEHARLVGGSFNKQGNLHRRLVQAAERQPDGCTHPLES